MEMVVPWENDAFMARISDLPAGELLEVWESLTAVVARRAFEGPVALTSEPDGGHTLDGQLDELITTRRELEHAAQVAQHVSRRADAVLHLVAGAHHANVKAHDQLSAERLTDPGAYPVEAGEYAAASMGAALALSTSAARTMAETARSLRLRFPRLLNATVAGVGVMRVAGMLADELDHLDDEDAARVESVLVDGGVHRKSRQAARERCRAILRKMGLARPADLVVADRERGVWFEPHLDFDTLCRVTAVLDVHDAVALEAVIGERTRQLWENSTAGRGGPSGPLRADALVDLVLANSSVTATLNLTVPVATGETSASAAYARSETAGNRLTPTAATRGGPPIPTALLLDNTDIVDAGALSPRADSAGYSRARDAARVPGFTADRLGNQLRPRPGLRAASTGSIMCASGSSDVTTPHEMTAQGCSCTFSASASAQLADCLVPGVGVIPATAVARIAMTAGTGFTATLTSGANGRITTLATTTHAYRPTVGIAKLVRERDEVCRFPYCTASAAHADLDHVLPFDQGGPTTATNLQALCRHHHRAKTHGGFTVTMTPDGDCTWTSPTGSRWLTEPGGVTRQVQTPARVA